MNDTQIKIVYKKPNEYDNLSITPDFGSACTYDNPAVSEETTKRHTLLHYNNDDKNIINIRDTNENIIDGIQHISDDQDTQRVATQALPKPGENVIDDNKIILDNEDLLDKSNLYYLEKFDNMLNKVDINDGLFIGIILIVIILIIIILYKKIF